MTTSVTPVTTKGRGSPLVRLLKRMVAWVMPKQEPNCPEAIATGHFGEAAAASLPVFLANQPRCAATTWGPPGLRCVAMVPYVQLWPNQPPQAMSTVPLAYEGERWHTCEGVSGWHALTRAYGVDVTSVEGQEAAMAALDMLVHPGHLHAAALRTAEQVEALLTVPTSCRGLPWSEPPQPADPEVVATFIPPHLDGSVFRFHALLPDAADDGHANTLAICAIELSGPHLRVTRLGFGGTVGSWFFYR